MEYLYFDIECADGKQMCSFGYVITDEKFEIKEKRDILINPRCEFKLGRHGGEPYINLAYPTKEFYASPAFDEFYEEIRGLLMCKNRGVLGHAIYSDVEFLDIACDRYKLPRINVTAYDTQKIYEHYSQNENVKSLEKIMEELNVSVEHLSAHKSCDDAEMSMLTMREICKASQTDIAKCLAAAKKYTVDRKYMEISYRCRKIRKFMTNLKRKANNKDSKKIYIEDVIERIKVSKTREILHAIYNAGYGFSFDKEKCDYIVSDAAPAHTENKNAKYINYAELSEMLGVTIDSSGDVKYIERSSAGTLLETFFKKAAANKKKKAK